MELNPEPTMTRDEIARWEKHLNQNRPNPEPRSSFSTEADQILMAMGPTTLAGGLFPTVAGLIWLLGAVAYFLFAVLTGAETIDSTDLLALAPAVMSFLIIAVIGFAIGCAYTVMIAALFASLVAFFHWSTRERFHPRILSQLVGGATGFWAIAPVGFSGMENWKNSEELWAFGGILLLATLAMVMGHYATANGYQRMHRGYQRDSKSNDLQFGIQDMMVATTWAAALIALFGVLPRNSFAFLTCWVVLQSLAFAIGESVRRLRKK